MRSQNRPVDYELLSIHEHRGQMRSYGNSTYPSRRPGGKHGRCEAIEREAHTSVIPFGSPPVIHHVVSDAYGVLRGLKINQRFMPFLRVVWSYVPEMPGLASIYLPSDALHKPDQ